MVVMDRDAVRAFVRRDRTLVAQAKASWWANADRRLARRASWELWVYARTVRPDWPTAAERQADLDHHVRLKAILDRAACAFTRR
jgi:hypothetical protein